MRDFSWKYFTSTGNIDAYLLYKHIDADHEEWELEELEQQESVDTSYNRQSES